MVRGPLLGEFMGTFVLILMGGGVVGGAILRKTKAEGAGWISITAGWAFAVLSGIFVSQLFGSADAHLNPAVTLAFAVKAANYTTFLPYFLAQTAGAFLAGVALWAFFLPHWEMTEDPGTKLAVFSTGPTVRNYAWALFCEVLATFVLIIVIGGISTKLVMTTGVVAGLSPLLVACLVWGVGLSLGGTTGYAINPARDLGPRLAHMILPIKGKGTSDWAYAWVPVVGPLIGAAIAGYVLRLLNS